MKQHRRYPKVIVWDLDGTIWDPEMYQLWGGGAPFKRAHDDHLNVNDRSGTEVRVLEDARAILKHLKEERSDVDVAIASTCDEPRWAYECLKKIRVDKRHERESALEHYFHPELIEIYKAHSKEVHLKAIAKKSGAKLSEMVFFDNQRNNCHTAERIGVHAVYTPDGVTHSIFEDALEAWAAKN